MVQCRLTTTARLVALLVATCLLAFPLLGCTPDDSFGQFRASSFAEHLASSCVAEAFPLDLTLFGAQTTFDTTTVRMRSQGATPYDFNQAMLIVHKSREIQAAVATAGATGVSIPLLEPEGARCANDDDCASGTCDGMECIAPPTQDTLIAQGPLARVEIGLDQGCELRPGGPRLPISLTVRSCAIRLSAFDPSDDGRIEGRLEERGCQLIDARTGATVASEIGGNWRMVVHEGQPYQDFFDTP